MVYVWYNGKIKYVQFNDASKDEESYAVICDRSLGKSEKIVHYSYSPIRNVNYQNTVLRIEMRYGKYCCTVFVFFFLCIPLIHFSFYLLKRISKI